MPGSPARTPDGEDGASLDALQQTIDSVVAGTPGISWSIDIRKDGISVASHEPLRVVNTASIGKVFVLWAAAEAFEEAALDPQMTVLPHPDDAVADSGLWQHMHGQELTLESLCVLIASVSDNLATNVLIRLLTLRRVQQVSDRLGYSDTRMLDRIRDFRTPDDPPAPSVGCASDLADVMHQIGRQGGAVERRLARWLTLNTDLSMVANTWNLDPLAHSKCKGFPLLINKTGTDAGVRADAGSWVKEGPCWSYAVLANWDSPADATRAVMEGIRSIGQHMALEGCVSRIP